MILGPVNVNFKFSSLRGWTFSYVLLLLLFVFRLRLLIFQHNWKIWSLSTLQLTEIIRIIRDRYRNYK